jgi:hypothetical protein
MAGWAKTLSSLRPAATPISPLRRRCDGRNDEEPLSRPARGNLTMRSLASFYLRIVVCQSYYRLGHKIRQYRGTPRFRVASAPRVVCPDFRSRAAFRQLASGFAAVRNVITPWL